MSNLNDCRFERLHADWLTARAAAAEPLDTNELAEEKVAIRELAQIEAARRLLAYPAISTWQVWIKIEILDVWLNGEATDGQYLDCRVIAAWGAVKSDIARLGIKENSEDAESACASEADRISRVRPRAH